MLLKMYFTLLLKHRCQSVADAFVFYSLHAFPDKRPNFSHCSGLSLPLCCLVLQPAAGKVGLFLVKSVQFRAFF